MSASLIFTILIEYAFISKPRYQLKLKAKNRKEPAMEIQYIQQLINNDRKIEFDFNENRYSITYYNDNMEKYISFCKFSNEPIDVKNAEELFKLKIGNQTLEQIFKSLKDSSFDIY